jgi:hypothetical protein
MWKKLIAFSLFAILMLSFIGAVALPFDFRVTFDQGVTTKQALDWIASTKAIPDYSYASAIIEMGYGECWCASTRALNEKDFQKYTDDSYVFFMDFVKHPYNKTFPKIVANHKAAYEKLSYLDGCWLKHQCPPLMTKSGRLYFWSELDAYQVKYPSWVHPEIIPMWRQYIGFFLVHVMSLRQ